MREGTRSLEKNAFFACGRVEALERWDVGKYRSVEGKKRPDHATAYLVYNDRTYAVA